MKFGITGNTKKPELLKAFENLLANLRSRGIEYILERELAVLLSSQIPRSGLKEENAVEGKDLANQCDMMIALGGDGTILRTARLVGSAGVPIVGVNLGKLGFLAEFSVDDIPALIDQIIKHNYTIEDRMVLRGEVTSHGNQIFFGLNDIVIDKWAYSRIIHIETYVNEEYLVTYSADGIVVSTPTGSTGYSLSAQGPIITPDAKTILITPLSPHSLTARPMIVPDTSVIKVLIYSEAEKLHVAADGQVSSVFSPPLEIVIKKADYVVRLIRRTDQTFFDVLRSKLMWGRDIRAEKIKK